MKKHLSIFAGVLISSSFSINSLAQTNTELFGQNRVQLRSFDWKYYQTKGLKVYFYDRAGVELSRYVAEQLEKDMKIVESKMGDLFPNGLDVILYNSYGDFQQTNIGLASNNNVHNNNAGQVNIIGNKLLIYFTGKHEDIKRQLNAALYSVILEKTLFGETIGEALRNSLVLDFPKWYTEGYLNYMVDGWSTAANNEWKAVIQNPKASKKFEQIAMDKPVLAGKAFWKYLIERYGDKNVRDFIFIAQNENNMNSAMKALTGQKVVPTFDSLINFYQQTYLAEAGNQINVNAEAALIDIQSKDSETNISNIKVSPRGFDVAYIASKHGQFDILLQKSEQVDGLKKNRISKLLSGGYINHNEQGDPNYPMMAWSNTGFKLGIIYRKYNQTYIRIYDAVKAKITEHKIAPRKFDRILSFTFMEDDDMLVFSAIKNGQSDIFEYRIKRGQVNQITDDTYDDLDPIYVSGGARKGIAFLSNRPEPVINIKPLPNELPTGKLKGYFYNATTKNYDLLALTPKEKCNVTQIIPYGPDHFAFLTNENGVNNRNVVVFERNEFNQDVAKSVPVTNGNFSILEHQYNPASKSIADAIRTESGIQVYFRKIELPEPFGNLSPLERSTASLVEEPFLASSKPNDLLQDRRSQKTVQSRAQHKANTPFLQSKFNNKNTTPEATPSIDTATVVATTKDNKILYVDSTYIRLKSLKYRRSFKVDFYSLRIDNNQIFTRYQNFNGAISTPTLGGMLSASVYDKMEDYRFTGGYRLPVLSNGSAYFFQFDNFKKRLDWGLTYYREVKNEQMPLVINTGSGAMVRYYNFKPIVNILQGYTSYPLDRTKSIRLNLALRQDRTSIKTNDFVSTVIPNEDKFYVNSRAEYVHDDTRMKALNLPDGLKLKLYGEYLYKLKDDNVYITGDAPRKKQGGLYNVGFDIRNYHQLYENITLALRASFGHSGGNERVMYVMGGVDNALNAKMGMYPYGQLNYAFQSLTTSMRGYDQNARNGNTFGLINAEIRVPVFETLFRRPAQSTIWKNLQAVAFIDAGSAWEGFVPLYGERNKRVGTFIAPDNPNSPSRIEVKIPFVGDDNLCVGYGAGLRTMIYGYFLRADAAWNINREFRFHLSMGMDF